jgi:hypothetical protein
MLPFCQRYKTAAMYQRTLISPGRRENYSFDGVPSINGNAVDKTFQTTNYSSFLSRMTVLQSHLRVRCFVNRELSNVSLRRCNFVPASVSRWVFLRPYRHPIILSFQTHLLVLHPHGLRQFPGEPTSGKEALECVSAINISVPFL